MPYDEMEELRAARRELDLVVEEVQRVPGFETFLAPPTVREVGTAAQDRPLVYLSASEAAGTGLLVRGERIEHVPLPALTAHALRLRTEAYLTAHRADKRHGTADWRAVLDDITGWLWDAVMGPVLDRMTDDTAATLVAGGLLGLLPLHAAWTPDTARPTGRRYALDHLVLAYTPNARALSTARELAAMRPVERLVTVADPPRSPAGSRLGYARSETLAAEAAFPGGSEFVGGPGADARTVTAALHGADVVHLACHGKVDLVEPLNSHLLLAGTDQLTLRDLLTVRLRLRLRLAVLSACETSVPGGRLPDEVVSLPTGLLQAGVAGVLASLWEVTDVATAMLMTEFYRRWRHTDGVTSPSEALAGAQVWLRDTTNSEKLRCYEDAERQRAAWLPTQSGQGFRLALHMSGAPTERSYAHPDLWAGFAHVGA
ncbi:CHAT domain-containing protein [Streptomyces sp. NPDC048278]|uniref:CHAT domain-containing protein n=1 Tax=Streptomyces sp. NPDC048278 TaxID=3155809 RepID=UPI00341DB054